MAWQAVIDSVGNGLGLGVLAIYIVTQTDLTPRSAGWALSAAGAVGFLATVPMSRLAQLVGPHKFAVATNIVRGILFLCLAAAPADGTVVTGLLVGVAIAEAAGYSIYQIIIAQAVGEASRQETLAVRRVLGNIGFLLAAPLVSAVVLVDSPAIYHLAFAVDSATFFASALIVANLPALSDASDFQGESAPRAVADVRYLALTISAGIYALSIPLIEVGLPLWITQHTQAGSWALGLVLAIGPVMVIALQVRLARGCDQLPKARVALIRSAIFFGAACIGFAWAGHSGPWLAVLLLTVAMCVATLAEILESAAWWTVSYELAPPSRRAEYLGTFDLATPLVQVVGPAAMVAVVLAGVTGWLVLGLVFLLAGAVSGWLTLEPSRRGPA